MSNIPYRIIRKLGTGGMADVYEAEAGDGRRVALKVFRREKESTFLTRRFFAEAKILQRLYHPNIIRVHEYGLDEAHGTPWYAMDLVTSGDGRPSTLEDCRRQARGNVSGETLQRWFLETKGALEYLHKCGIVHRDVKLENILIDQDGHARLADFGVSRIMDRRLKSEIGVDSTMVTGESTEMRPVVGTYFYLPQDVRGGKSATPESDFYALGVAFFRLLTGLWYEPGTNALDLLSPFPAFWRENLCAMLAGTRKERAAPLWRRKSFAVAAASLLALAAFFAAVAFGVVSILRQSAAPADASPWALPSSFAVPLAKELPLSNYGGSIGFCACPPGSFDMSNLDGSATNCHRVVITRPFWISGNLVTARQFRSIIANTQRDAAALEWEKAFAQYDVVARVWYLDAEAFCRSLDRAYRHLLPEGYVVRLPTEAELEYALTEGGKWPVKFNDVYWDVSETKKLVAGATNRVDVVWRDDLRLFPRRTFNGWGIGTGWTDSEQVVLDCVDSLDDLAYASEETDPLRKGEKGLIRQAHNARWLCRRDWINSTIRICIGPVL